MAVQAEVLRCLLTYNLVDAWRVFGLASEQISQVLHSKVAAAEFRQSGAAQSCPTLPDSPDSDTLGLASVLRLAAAFPTRGTNLWSTFWTMDEVQINVIESGFLQRNVDGVKHAFGIFLVVHELGCVEDILTWYSALLDKVTNSAPSVLLVLVPFSRVDVTITCLESPFNRVVCLWSCGTFVHA